ncbi:deoxycytidylate deaminase [Virgibacillus salexigens]|uniref:deoxycytidylate deaminase n=1 Tax=Virgibacillus massiliensis TaxID=1462526 RepID=UPI0018E0CDA9|nr:dCMP deaminase family protein [Virgibacillus massiliensis]
MLRKTWDEYFIDQATLVSQRATCDRLHVGCVLVKDNRIIATGYNGSISGHTHCDDEGHLMYEGGCKRTIHAELNALLQCAKHGVSCEGAIAYVTDYPCPDCMKSLNQAGIKKVIYKKMYPHRYNNSFNEGMDIKEC